MSTERVLAGLLLLFSVYGGLWAVICKPSWTPISGFLVLIAIWTVNEVWNHVEVSESDQG